MILKFFNTIFIYHDCEEISNMTLPCVFQVTMNFTFCFMNYNTISRFFNPIKPILLPTITHHQLARKKFSLRREIETDFEKRHGINLDKSTSPKKGCKKKKRGAHGDKRTSVQGILLGALLLGRRKGARWEPFPCVARASFAVYY